MGKNIGINISKILSGKYSQKIFDHAKESATDAFKNASTVETAGDLIRNTIADKITKISKTSQQNNLGIFPNEDNKEKPK